MYDKELIELLNSNDSIKKVWLNEDKTIWHTYEVKGFVEITREEILNPKTIKNGIK